MSCSMTSKQKLFLAKNSDTGNRTPGYRVRGDNVSHYTISEYYVEYAVVSQWLEMSVRTGPLTIVG